MAKRKLPSDLASCEEFDDVSSAHSSPSASLHALVANVSPMKKGKQASYFEGKLTDGTKHIRVVGFVPDQQKKLASFCEKGDSVELRNCELKPARQSDDLEVILKGHSLVHDSPKKFDVKDISAIGSSNITLNNLADKANFDKVSFSAKVTRVSNPIHVSGGKTKQDIVVADTLASARVTLWEDDVGKLKKDSSYKFTNFVVRTYAKEKYISLPKEGATMTAIEDLGEVYQDEPAETSFTVHGCEIAGVLSFNNYHICLSCKKKVVPTTQDMGRCTNCNSLQRLNKCKFQMSAKLLVSSGETYLTLLCFGTNLNDIVQQETVTEEALVNARPFTLTYEYNIITGVQRS